VDLEEFTPVTHHEASPRLMAAYALYPDRRVNTDRWAHLPADERESILQPDVWHDAAVVLAARGPDGMSGKSIDAEGWGKRWG